jgi:hypothetical protein
MSIIHGFKIYKAHNCMSFTSKIIEMSESIKMKNPYYKYNIKELDDLLEDYLYKEDYFKKEKIETKDYMKYIGPIKNTILFVKLNAKLLYRMIMKGNKEYD